MCLNIPKTGVNYSLIKKLKEEKTMRLTEIYRRLNHLYNWLPFVRLAKDNATEAEIADEVNELESEVTNILAWLEGARKFLNSYSRAA